MPYPSSNNSYSPYNDESGYYGGGSGSGSGSGYEDRSGDDNSQPAAKKPAATKKPAAKKPAAKKRKSKAPPNPLPPLPPPPPPSIDPLASQKAILDRLIASQKTLFSRPASTPGFLSGGVSTGLERAGVNQQASAGESETRRRSRKSGRASTFLTGEGAGLGTSGSASSARKTLLGA